MAFFIATCLFVPEKSYRRLPIRGLGFFGLVLLIATTVADLGGAIYLVIYSFSHAQETDEAEWALFDLVLGVLGIVVAVVPALAAAVLFSRIKPKRTPVITGTVIILLLAAAYVSLAHFVLF